MVATRKPAAKAAGGTRAPSAARTRKVLAEATAKGGATNGATNGAASEAECAATEGVPAPAVPTRWSAYKQALFIAELARTCNVSASAERAGMSDTSVYRQRQRSPAFRAVWQAALKVAYERLEMVLLQRAIEGAETSVADEKLRAYSDGLAFKLLAAHRSVGAPAAPGKPGKSPRERIEAKIAEMNRRLDADAVKHD